MLGMIARFSMFVALLAYTRDYPPCKYW